MFWQRRGFTAGPDLDRLVEWAELLANWLVGQAVDPSPRVPASRQEAVFRRGKSLILPAAEHSICRLVMVSRLPVGLRQVPEDVSIHS